MKTSASSVALAAVCVLVLSSTSARASAPTDNWQPYGASSQPAAQPPATPPAEPPAEPTPPTQAPAAAAASDKQPTSDLMVHLAQYGGGCLTGCLASQLLGMVLGPCACVAPIVRPVVTGAVIGFIGNTLGDRKMSTVSMAGPIVSACIGDYCLSSVCGATCSIIGIAAFLPAMAAFVAGMTSRTEIAMAGGAVAYVAGAAILMISILGGQMVAAILSPVIPTAVYHFLAEGEEPSSQPAAQPAAPTASAVTPRTAPPKSPAAQAVAY